MDNDKKAVLKKYLISFGVATAIALFILAMRKFEINMGYLCDAFMISGWLMLCFFGLLYIQSEGLFISLGYAMSQVVRVFIPYYKRKVETYAQYYERKSENLHDKGDLCILFTGLAFFLIGIVFMILHLYL